MRWLWRGHRRLKALGILGMNRRNAEFILDHNPRAGFPLVDDKLRMDCLCREIGVPAPTIFAEIASQSCLGLLENYMGRRSGFVLKPNRGSGGRGILVFTGCTAKYFIRHNGERMRLEDVRQHISDILSGMYSLGGRPDTALVQQRIRLHAAFRPVAYKGIPDVRIILYRREPAMAMLRLPTKASDGKANLHQGGIGAGLDLQSGMTTHAVKRNRSIEVHPDTGYSLVGLEVPFWPRILEMAWRVADAVDLGYLGVDIIVDEVEGPMLLEANARPGLAIQMANGCGLLPRLSDIDKSLSQQGKSKRPPRVPAPAPVSLSA
jgi:alpha-L-glutamate ligase-like protein